MKNLLFTITSLLLTLLIFFSCTVPKDGGTTGGDGSGGGTGSEAVPAPSGYIARWSMDGDGDDNNSTINLSNQTGNPSYSSDSPKEGTDYLVLDGNDDLNSANYAITKNAFTISGWIYLDSTFSGTFPTIFKLGLIQAYYRDFSGAFYADIGGATILTMAPFTTDSWHHIVFTYDGATSRLYHNGELKSSRAASSDVSTVNAKLYVGSVGGADYWKGSVDDLIFYERALTATEITTLYNAY